MSKPFRARRPLANSPFAPPPEPVIEEYAVGDRVSHDVYGLGRITKVEGTTAVIADFTSLTARITSPFTKLDRL